MKGFELMKQGAEAKLYKGTYLGKPTIAKLRFKKKYRHPSLDNELSSERIRAEGRAIVRCKAAGINTPTLYLVDFERRAIFMEYYTHSITSKEFIYKGDKAQIKKLAETIGKVLAKMHSNNIIHGDLTTSNILLVNKHNKDEFDNMDDLKLVMIDFGLAHVESSAEDKGVDLYVLERALISTHSIETELFPDILKTYQSNFKNGQKEIVAKFEEVRARGRKRTMVG